MAIEQAKDAALRYLTHRIRAAGEVRRHLLQKGYAHDEVEAVLDFLFEYEFLDDLAFAEAFVRDKLRFHPQGSLKLRQGLRQKDVPETIIDRALARNYPPDLQRRFAALFYKEACRRGKDDLSARRFLAQKGVPGDIIAEIPERWAKQLDRKPRET